MPRLAPPAIAPGSIRRLPQPVLRSDTLVLRPWQAGDEHAVVKAYADPDIRHWHDRSMDGDEAAAWVAHWAGRWQAETGAGWAITIDDVPVGQISLRTFEHGDGISEVSYWLLPQARGRGAATTALRTVAGWGFETLGLHRIEVEHATQNTASCRVATRAGFPLEGTRRGAYLQSDGRHDAHLHARLAGDLS